MPKARYPVDTRPEGERIAYAMGFRDACHLAGLEIERIARYIRKMRPVKRRYTAPGGPGGDTGR